MKELALNEDYADHFIANVVPDLKSAFPFRKKKLINCVPINFAKNV